MGLREIFEIENEMHMGNVSAKDIASVYFGMKDGTSLRFDDSDFEERLEEELEDLGLAYEKSDRGDEVFYYVAQEQSHIDNHDIPDRMNPEKPGGEFYGYPQDAIEFYNNNMSGGAIVTEKEGSPVEIATEYMEEELGVEDCLYLVNYCPAPTEESVREAFEREVRRREKLRQYDFIRENKPIVTDEDAKEQLEKLK